MRGSSDLINREKVKLYSYPSLCESIDDLVVKLDLWRDSALSWKASASLSRSGSIG